MGQRTASLVVAALLTACVNPSPVEGEGEGDDDEAAAALRAYVEAECFYTAVCQRLAEFQPQLDLAATCVPAMLAFYTDTRSGRRVNLEAMAECAPQLLACDIDFSADAPCGEVFPGPRSDVGEPCRSNSDCADEDHVRCVAAAGETCGACAPRDALDEVCEPGSCDASLRCDDAADPPRCVPSAALGAACDGFGDDDSCEDGSLCQGDTRRLDDSADGLCVPFVFQPGDACRTDCLGVTFTGLFCDDGVCVPSHPAGLGEECQPSGDLERNDASICVNSRDNLCLTPVTGESGVCRARAELGEPCVDGQCRAGACVDGTCSLLAEGDACRNFGECDASAFFCDGTCQPRRGLGAPCRSSECIEGAFCADGVCVDSFGQERCVEG